MELHDSSEQQTIVVNVIYLRRLTVIRLNPDGTTSWRQTMSPTLALPQLDVAANGDVLVMAKGHGSLEISRFSPHGVLLRQRRFRATQGAMAAGSDGQVVLLYQEHGDSGPVFLSGLDKRLRRLWTVAPPMAGIGGLVAVWDSYIAIGKQDRQPGTTLVEVNRAGRILVQTPMEHKSDRILLQAPSGYYMVDLGARAIDVTRMVTGPVTSSK